MTDKDDDVIIGSAPLSIESGEDRLDEELKDERDE